MRPITPVRIIAEFILSQRRCADIDKQGGVTFHDPDTEPHAPGIIGYEQARNGEHMLSFRKRILQQPALQAIAALSLRKE